MKAILKQLGLFVVTTVYCVAILTVTAVITPNASADTTSASLHKPSTSPTVANNLFAYISTAENTADTSTNFPVPDTQETAKWSKAATKTAAYSGSAIFYQYTHSANHFFIGYSKASILFPFHYFW